jgi:hypothetical protein
MCVFMCERKCFGHVINDLATEAKCILSRKLTHTHTHTHTHTQTHTYTHTHRHTYTHTYTHTHMPKVF